MMPKNTTARSMFTAVAAETFRIRNKRGGSTGSRARRSPTTKATNSSALPAKTPTSAQDSHAIVAPPRKIPNIRKPRNPPRAANPTQRLKPTARLPRDSLNAWGRPGDRRSRHEHHDAEEKQPLPSIEVRQLPEDRDRDDLYDEEGAEDPSIQTQPSELGDDRRACRRHDGDVHEGQQEPG